MSGLDGGSTDDLGSFHSLHACRVCVEAGEYRISAEYGRDR